MTPEDPGTHLESGAVAAYLDRALRPTERERLEAHLADCAECRQEVIEVSRLRHTRSRRSRWMMVGPAVVAAAVAVLVIARPADTPTPGPVLRDAGERPGLMVALVTPAETAAVEGRSLTFTWRSAGAGVSYRLTLTDERGDVVWSLASPDTTARLPNDVALRTGRPHFWYVDALLPDGRSVTSDVRQFTARP